MSANLNKVILDGFCIEAPREIETAKGGTKVSMWLEIPGNEPKFDTKIEVTAVGRCVADALLIREGDPVMVEGELNSRKSEKTGHSFVNVIVYKVYKR